MEEENDKNIIIINNSQNQKNLIIKIGKDLDEEMNNYNQEIKEANLYYYFFENDIYKDEGSEIKDKEKYIKLIYILDQFIKEKNDFIFLYFRKVNIDLMYIVLKGYISFDFQDSNQKQIILTTIKNIINSYFTRNLFYFVYNELSKIFRTFNAIDNKELLFDKFNKSFTIWNFIFDSNIEVKSNYIGFIGNQVLTLEKNIEDIMFNKIYIYIEFEEGINPLNDNNTNFSLVNVQYSKYGLHTLKSDGILTEKEKENINNIYIQIDGISIGYIFNVENDSYKVDLDKLNKIMEFNKVSDISKIEILKNYIGKIKLIKLKLSFHENKCQNIEYKIIPGKNKQGYNIISTGENEEIVKLFFDDKILYSKIYDELLFEDIRYYGGMECFIPIIKIIKYFMNFYKEDKDKIDILNDILIKIMKKIIKLICYSKNNFDNFKKILTSLIAAIAEINHIYPNNLQNNFYSNYVFSWLYFLIINSELPYSIKKSYILITGLDNMEKLNLNIEEYIVDVNNMSINSCKCYLSILISYLEFILLKFNDINLVPKKLIEQLLLLQESTLTKDAKLISLINFSFQIFNYICFTENENNLLFPNVDKIKDLTNFLKLNIIHNEENLIFILDILKVYFNIINFDLLLQQNEEKIENDKNGEEKKEEEAPNNQNNKDIYKNLFENFFNNFETVFSKKNEKIEKLVFSSIEDYAYNKDYLKKIFHFLVSNNDFKLESEIIFSEFIDFHKDYHKLMKNIFIFNKFWSDKNLFFDEEKKRKYLKYKSINYYTMNYQRPLIFPDLDYKTSYPNFTNFVVGENFYMCEENPDDYNFSLECPELDDFNIEYEQKLLQMIKTKNIMNIIDVCLVKKTHHVKGKLVICIDNTSLMKKILFISYPKNIEKNIPCCNVLVSNPNYNSKKQKLCYGAVFVCPEKYMNIKIVIHVKDIRMVLKKIYFYRKSAVEIFTTNKSYFFNFVDDPTEVKSKVSQKSCEDFINMFGFFVSEFFPVIIRNDIIGHSRQFQEMLTGYKTNEKKYDISIGNKFISYLFGHWNDTIKGVKLSTLDLLIYLNLFSNRSYNDLFQYPVFPLLFFYDKLKDNSFQRLERKLSLHIGFQVVCERAKQRKSMIKASYNDSLKEFEEAEEGEPIDIPSYFKTHYSTHFYVCNFQIRLFPYSFLGIELQGNGFDTPNRLFFSIEETLYNILCHKSDLREFIPEFYYFPELFWNINKINFRQRTNGIQVDDVEMPQDLSKIGKDNNERTLGNSINLNDEYEKTDYYKSFKFVEKMRNLLESRQTDIISWINIIFGPGQKYNNPKKEDLYFRNESYIGYSNDKNPEFRAYRQDKAFMTSVEFGMTPVQTVYEGDIGKTKNRNNTYDLNLKEEKELFKKLGKQYTDRIRQEKDLLDNLEKNKINNTNSNNSRKRIIFEKNCLYKIMNANNKSQKSNISRKNNSDINDIFSNPNEYINCVFRNDDVEIIGYKTGKVEVYNKKDDGKEKISEFFDHNDEVIHINYNQRLNMLCTTSKDGYLNVYILPNKLITVVKNPNDNSYFSYGFLCSNPFPAIIAIEEESYDIFSYSINGFKLKKAKLITLLELNDTNKNLWITAYFNEEGGNFKDRLIFIEKGPKEKESFYKCHFVRVPFFEQEDKPIEIKNK